MNETHQKILRAAHQLFATKGYKGVTMREITRVLGLKHTALYYYAKNKEDLYMQVMQRNFLHHRDQMESILEQSDGDLRSQMKAVAAWLLTQPPLHLGHLMQSDFSYLEPENAKTLVDLAFDSLRMPLTRVLNQAKADNVIGIEDPGLAAISFISLVETINGTQYSIAREQRMQIVEQIIDMLLNGLLIRQ